MIRHSAPLHKLAVFELNWILYKGHKRAGVAFILYRREPNLMMHI